MIRWDPARSIERLQKEINRIFDRALPRPDYREPWRWPEVDLFEKDGHIVIQADLPGIKPQDIEVRVSEDTVRLKGKVEEERRAQADGYYHFERRRGEFYRTIPLPRRVKSQEARASYRRGTLEIRIPLEGDRDEGVKVNIEEGD